jgi:hypothetical protein
VTELVYVPGSIVAATAFAWNEKDAAVRVVGPPVALWVTVSHAGVAPDTYTKVAALVGSKRSITALPAKFGNVYVTVTAVLAGFSVVVA